MLIVYLWHGTQYQSQQAYRNQEADYAAFRHYLSQHKKATIALIVDTVEEEYQLEVLPHVRKPIRSEMLARKLGQFNRHSVYKTAWLIRRENTTRKEDVFGFLSLTNTSWLQNWVDILQAEQSLLVGIYALPMLSQCMVRQMKIAPPQLLICERLASGFRQTYLEHGVLRISRLTPTESMQSLPLVDSYVTEIEKMWLYLLSQRIVNDAIVLQVMLSNLETDHHVLTTRLEQQGFECKIFNRQDGIKKSSIRQIDASRHPEFYYMQLLNRIARPANLAPAEMIKAYCVVQLTNKLYITLVMVMIIGVLISANFFLLGMNKNEQINDLTKQADLLRQQHASILSQSPQSSITGTDLKAVVTTAQSVSQQSPIAMMQIISVALKEMPEVTISRLRWVQTNREQMKDEDNSDVEQSSNRRDELNNALLQIGFADVNIHQLSIGSQQALASADQLVNHLRADSRVSTVEVIQMPVDEQFDGNTSDQLVVDPASVMLKLKIILSPAGNRIDD